MHLQQPHPQLWRPQGCVLSPLLYSLYTHDCTATHSTNTIVKFVRHLWKHHRLLRQLQHPGPEISSHSDPVCWVHHKSCIVWPSGHARAGQGDHDHDGHSAPQPWTVWEAAFWQAPTHCHGQDWVSEEKLLPSGHTDNKLRVVAISFHCCCTCNNCMWYMNLWILNLESWILNREHTQSRRYSSLTNADCSILCSSTKEDDKNLCSSLKTHLTQADMDTSAARGP